MKLRKTLHPALSRRDVLKLGLTAGAMGAVGSLGAAQEPEPGAGALPGALDPPAGRTRPNILLLITDQQRFDCIGAAGLNPAIQTPAIDRLAREGALFRHAYSCVPSCTPARTALLTGLAPWNNGMLGYGRIGEGYARELPQVLRDAGYATTGIGKMHFHPQRSLHGFERTILDESGRVEHPSFRSDYRAWLMSRDPTADPDATGLTFNDYRARPYALPEDCHPTHWTGETARHFLEHYDREEPFFLKVSFARPHNPFDPPRRFLELYADAAIPPPAIGSWAARHAPRQTEGWPDLWHGDMGAEQVRASRQGYYGNISFIDEQIGGILAVLEQRGMLEQTLIVFTSDHGEMIGDHHLWRKTYAYEGSAHIPLVVRWPRGMLPEERRGCRVDGPVELRDVMPTLMQAAGAPGAEMLDGHSLLPLIADDSAPRREYLDLEHAQIYDPSNHWTGLTDGRVKYIFHCADGEEMLFDLEDDPGETTNLAGEPADAERLALWRRRMIDHLAPRGEPFIRDGGLAIRSERMIYSPNWPGCACHGKAVRI